MAFAVGYSPVWSWCMIAKYGASFKVFVHLNSLSTFNLVYKFYECGKQPVRSTDMKMHGFQICILVFRKSKCKPQTTNHKPRTTVIFWSSTYVKCWLLCVNVAFSALTLSYVTKIIRLVYPLTNFLVDVSIVIYTSVINLAARFNKTVFLAHSVGNVCVFIATDYSFYVSCVFRIRVRYWTVLNMVKNGHRAYKIVTLCHRPN
jgi:hypothetical protein